MSILSKYCFFFLFLTTSILSAQNALLSTEELTKSQWFYSLEDALESPEKVYSLSITWEKLKAFPEEIFQFVNLQQLDLMDNEIESIPPEIGQLKNLQFLFLSNNKIKNLPDELQQLEQLKDLHLERNKIEQLPNWLKDLKSLQKIGLGENKLSNETINNLDKLPKSIKITR